MTPEEKAEEYEDTGYYSFPLNMFEDGPWPKIREFHRKKREAAAAKAKAKRERRWYRRLWRKIRGKS